MVDMQKYKQSCLPIPIPKVSDNRFSDADERR